MSTWRLPDGIDELVGNEALIFENLRRKLLDLYKNRGFNLVIPPIVENIDSLLLTAKSLDLKTFKFLDPASGNMLGIHADITPQIARIDAKLSNNKIAKYCYINTILQVVADDFYSSRSPIQAGAELYGAENIEADVEIIQLMLDSLQILSIKPIILSIGNVAIFNTLITTEGLSLKQIAILKQIFQKRSIPELDEFLKYNNINNAKKLRTLIELEGGAEVCDKALTTFNDIADIQIIIKNLIKISNQLKHNNIKIIYDLAQIKSYEYHNGIIFSAYNINYSKTIAQGGRYNGLNKSFGKSRAATGFSFDLKFLSKK